MSEDNTIRAIVIGSTVIILIITLTAIILYYNTAVDFAQVALRSEVNYVEAYNRNIKDIKGMSLQGTELVSLIRNNIKDYDSIDIDCDGVTITVQKDSINNVKDSNLANINKADNYYVDDIHITSTTITLRVTKTFL